MKWLTFAQFLDEFKNAPHCTLETSDNGIIMNIQLEKDGPVQRYHSPDKTTCDPQSWADFCTTLELLYDAKAEKR